MPLPITIPNTFANATATIPLSQLDNNFSTVAVAVNSIGNGAFTLANAQITGGTISNVTLDNVSVDVETLSNVTITNLTVNGNATLTNATVTANVATITTANTTDVTASNSAVISVNTSGNALHITQVGSGNALLVEDSANPDSTPFVVDASGNVGIGTSSPTPYGPSALGKGLHISAPQPVLRLQGGTTAYYDLYCPSGTNAFAIFDANASVDRLRIDSSGNLGLGVTPSAWSTSFGQKAFQFGPVGSLMSLQASTTNNQTYINSNAVNLAGGWTYMYSDYATQYRQYAGTHAWFTAPLGTGGNAFTFTQAMTLDASGNFLVGTTSQAGGSNITFNQPANADMKIAASASTATRAAYQVFINTTVSTVGTENSTGGSLVSGSSAYSTVIANSGAYPLSFGTNNTERMRITSGGDLLVGLTSGAKFSVSYGGNDTHFGLGANYDNYITAGSSGVTIFRNTSAERARITSVGNVKIGGTADRATTEGTNQLVIFNGTAPVGTLTNGVSFYSAAGEARVMDAAGNSTLLSPHDQATNEWIFHSKHTPSGKVLRIDVEKMLRFINDHFGLDMIQEFTEE